MSELDPNPTAQDNQAPHPPEAENAPAPALAPGAYILEVPTLDQAPPEDGRHAGQVPAQVPPGFVVGRCDLRDVSLYRAKGWLTVKPGARNPNDPTQPMIANEDDFRPVDPQTGVLLFKGDALLIRREEVAEAHHARAKQEALRMAKGTRTHAVGADDLNRSFLDEERDQVDLPLVEEGDAPSLGPRGKKVRVR